MKYTTKTVDGVVNAFFIFIGLAIICIAIRENSLVLGIVGWFVSLTEFKTI